MEAKPKRAKGRTSLIAALAFFAVVALALVGTMIFKAIGNDGDPSDPPASATTDPSPPPDTSASSPEPVPVGTKCPESSPDLTVPAEPLDEATFKQLNTVRYIAITPDHGPALRDQDGVYRCYDRSPTGAVLATLNFISQSAITPQLGYDERLVVDGPERQILEMQGPGDRLEAGVRLIGFAVSYLTDEEDDPDIAFVSVLAMLDDGSRRSVTASMAWDGGDWKIQPHKDTAEYYDFNDSPNLDGFVLWEPTP